MSAVMKESVFDRETYLQTATIPLPTEAALWTAHLALFKKINFSCTDRGIQFSLVQTGYKQVISQSHVTRCGEMGHVAIINGPHRNPNKNGALWAYCVQVMQVLVSCRQQQAYNCYVPSSLTLATSKICRTNRLCTRKVCKFNVQTKNGKVY